MARWIRLDVLWDDSPMFIDQGPGVELAWIKLLCYAKCAGSGGRVKAMADVVAAKRWGIPVTDVTAFLTVTTRNGALLIENGEWVIVNWSKYQESDPTAKDRMKRMRERNEPSQTQSVTDCYGVTPVTPTVTRRVTETETETEINTSLAKPSRNGSSKFHPPTVAEVKAYALERGWGIHNSEKQSEAFVDFYSSKGWKVGSAPMKDWQASWRNWERGMSERGLKRVTAIPAGLVDRG